MDAPMLKIHAYSKIEHPNVQSLDKINHLV